jgi:hypothetical protein
MADIYIVTMDDGDDGGNTNLRAFRDADQARDLASRLQDVLDEHKCDSRDDYDSVVVRRELAAVLGGEILWGFLGGMSFDWEPLELVE